MNEKLDIFSKEIYETSKQEFSIIDFETLVTKIRNHVSEVILKYKISNDYLIEFKIIL